MLEKLFACDVKMDQIKKIAAEEVSLGSDNRKQIHCLFLDQKFEWLYLLTTCLTTKNA